MLTQHPVESMVIPLRDPDILTLRPPPITHQEEATHTHHLDIPIPHQADILIRPLLQEAIQLLMVLQAMALQAVHMVLHPMVLQVVHMEHQLMKHLLMERHLTELRNHTQLLLFKEYQLPFGTILKAFSNVSKNLLLKNCDV